MKIFLAALEHKFFIPQISMVLSKYLGKVYVLGSYFYLRNGEKSAQYSENLPTYKDFMLDSGASVSW